MNLLISSLQIIILLQFSSLPIRCQMGTSTSNGNEQTSDRIHSKRIICVFPNRAIHRTGAGRYTVDHINPMLCTHLLYGFAILDKGTFNISIQDHDADITKKGYEKSVALKSKNPKLKVMISLGGWDDANDGSNKYDELTKQSSTIDTFVSSVMDFLQLHNFDGLDLDYDYRKNSVDRTRFPLLLVALRNAFNSKEYLLSVTLPAAVSGYSSTIGQDYDVPSLNKNVDFVNLRTFFYHGPEWEKTSADHHSPLYRRPGESLGNKNLNSNYSVNYWRDRNLDSHKINLLIPLFGLSWTLSHATTNYMPPALAVEKGPPGHLTGKPAGILSFHEICDAVRHEGWQEFSDPNELIGPYAVSQNDPKIWVGYDDPAMAVVKSKFIQSQGLGGAYLMDISYDDFHGSCGLGSNPITTAVYDTLNGITFCECVCE